MDIRAQLLAEIEAVLAQQNMSPTAFGLEVMGDPRFVFDLRNTKRSPQLRTVDFVRRFIAREYAPQANTAERPSTVEQIVGQ